MMYFRGPGIAAPAIEYALPASFVASPIRSAKGMIRGLGLGDDTSSSITSGLTILAVMAFGWLALKVVSHGKPRRRRV